MFEGVSQYPVSVEVGSANSRSLVPHVRRSKENGLNASAQAALVKASAPKMFFGTVAINKVHCEHYKESEKDGPPVPSCKGSSSGVTLSFHSPLVG